MVRRKWWILVPFVALTGVVSVLTYYLPRTFVSQTLIIVRPRDVSEDFVKDLIAGTPEERLRSIEQTILSRTNLIQILREFGDQLPEFRPLNMDEKVLKLHEQISILFDLDRKELIPRRDQQLMTSFRISYQNQNPELAQKIASKLTTLFIEQDNRTRETQVFGTTEFLAAELEKVGAQLQESTEKLKEVKSARQFELPNQLDTNLKTLDRLAQEKRTTAEALDRYAAMRLSLESMISQTPPTLVRAAPPIQRQFAPPDPIIAEYRKANAEFEDLSSRYTEKHPDVLVAKARLERLKKQLPPDTPASDSIDAATAPKPAEIMEPNPLYQKLVSQLQDLKNEYEIRERSKAFIDSEIAKYSSRVEKAPLAEADMSGVLQQNEELKKQYEDLKNKLSQARLAESLESKQKGSQFLVADPANYPLEPTKPNKLVVLLAGLAISLVLAVSVAAIIDITRQKVWTQSQIETLWAAPVLVDIPEIVTDADPSAVRKKRLVLVTSLAATMTVYSGFLYMMCWKHNFILQQLDPVLQKVVYK